MYVHLGQNTVIRSRDLIGIFDLEKTTISHTTRDFLAAATARDEVINVSPEMPKSFVVAGQRGEKNRVYISQISPATLLKRTDFMHTIANVTK